MKKLLAENYDAIFCRLGRAARPRSRHSGAQGSGEEHPIGIDWLSSVSFGHTDRIGNA